MKVQELILFRNQKYQNLLEQIAKLLESSDSPTVQWQKVAGECAGRLIELAVHYGFEGNVWHCFLALYLTEAENPYSISCEIKGEKNGSLNKLAEHDMIFIKQLFDTSLAYLDPPGCKEGIWIHLMNYHSGGYVHSCDTTFRERLLYLTKSLEQDSSVKKFQNTIAEFYRQFGVGNLGLNKAFRIREENSQIQLQPITNIASVYFRDIIGYEMQKNSLIENTEAFLSGKPANNVLLFGDSGTGKSSSIKAVLNEYYEKGLRMIEVYKHQFSYLSQIQELVKNRNYKFIIYMDDLSFEDSELEYKYLKAIMEGGLGQKPGNVLIYATSNRRHLIREKFSDKRELDDELHHNDTVQEKLSLAARFGESIYFGAPDKLQYQQIVNELAKRGKIKISQEELLAAANQWELNHGGRSARTASQFITYLSGKS